MEVRESLWKLVYPRLRARLVWEITALTALAMLPLVLTPFQLLFVTEVLIYVLFAISFNLLFGYTGLLSFGHAAYFSIGAYVAALIIIRVFPSLPLALLGGVAAATVAALVIGYFCVRLDEIYFAMLTLAFAQMIHAVIWKWDSVTGGSDGVIGIPRPALQVAGVQVDLSSPLNYYYFTLILIVVSIFIIWRIVNSPFGLTLRSIRENPERAEFVGIPMKRYRLLAFVISGAFSGLAGAIFAPFERAIAPEIAFWTKSAEPVMMSLLGGMGVFLGPAVGTIIFMLIKEMISSITEYWMIFVGAIVIALVIFFPEGVVGFLAERFGEVSWASWRLRD